MSQQKVNEQVGENTTKIQALIDDAQTPLQLPPKFSEFKDTDVIIVQELLGGVFQGTIAQLKEYLNSGAFTVALLDDIGDVNVTVKGDGQRLAWDETSQTWVPKTSTSGLGILQLAYKMDLPLDTTPNSGDVSRDVNTGIQGDPLILYFNKLDTGNTDLSLFFQEMQSGQWINMHDKANVANSEKYDITGAATLNGNVWEVPVKIYETTGDALTNNDNVEVFWRTISPDNRLPAGGNEGDALVKVSSTDYDTTWENAFMRWKGEWVNAEYHKNEVVTDIGWTMIANKTTTDRPSPQEVGMPEDSIDVEAILTKSSDTSVVRMVHEFTTTKAGFLKELQINIPDVTSGTHIQVTILNVSTGVARVVGGISPESDNWVTISANNIAYGIGVVLQVGIELYNTGTGTAFSGTWVSDIGGGTPATGLVSIDNGTTPATLNVNHTDDNGINRATNLDNLEVGSIVTIQESGDAGRSVTVSVDSVNTAGANNTLYNVTTINEVGTVRDNRDILLSFEPPLSVPTAYNEIAGYYPTGNPSWATVTSALFYDGVQQAGTTNAYGINLIFQEAFISPDWDVLATSQATGGSSEGGGGEIAVIDNLNSTSSTDALSANQGRILNQKPDLGESNATAYRGDRGALAYNFTLGTFAPVDAQKNVQSDWNAISGDALILNKPTIPSEAAVPLNKGASSGTVDGSNVAGNYYNMSGSASIHSTYVIQNGSNFGYIEVRVNRGSEPTVDSAVKIYGSDFELNVDMLLCMMDRGRSGGWDYWFEKLNV